MTMKVATGRLYRQERAAAKTCDEKNNDAGKDEEEEEGIVCERS